MQRKIILVSASPRRKELMKQMGLEFIVDTGTSFVESIPEGVAVEDIPMVLAVGKSKGFHRDVSQDEVLVSADTVVICDGKIMGKPHNVQEAEDMLHLLNARSHKVVSAVCVRDSQTCKALSDTAFVTFSKLSDKEISDYVSQYKPIDKAGGYGIQEWIGLIGIERIEGSFFTIMGLPTHLLYHLLKEFDL